MLNQYAGMLGVKAVFIGKIYWKKNFTPGTNFILNYKTILLECDIICLIYFHDILVGEVSSQGRYFSSFVH